jgi:hypothetical protein
MTIYSKTNSPNGFYVYAYIRSKDSDTAKAGTPYYIGKGKDDRAWKKGKHEKIKVPTNHYYVTILEYNLTEVGALAIERRMIKWYGRVDNNTGILRNMTEGGDGTSGFKITGRKNGPCASSTKVKIGDANRGKKQIKPAWNKNKTGVYSEETLRHWSTVRKGRPRSEEDKEKLRTPHATASCIYCRKSGGLNTMKQFHFDKCRHNPNGPDISFSKKKLTCPHCNLEGGSNMMKRYHFSKCKLNPNRIPADNSYPETRCQHCGKVGGLNSMKRYHHDNCKFKPPTQL